MIKWMQNILLISLIVLNGCGLFDENIPSDPQPPTTRYFLELNNQSTHNIEIKLYSNGDHFDSYFLNVTKDTVIYDYFEEPLLVFANYGDSVQIFFDDFISINHNRDLHQLADRSLLLPSSYEGGKVNDEQLVFSYDFTDLDYEEAVNKGG